MDKNHLNNKSEKTAKFPRPVIESLVKNMSTSINPDCHHRLFKLNLNKNLWTTSAHGLWELRPTNEIKDKISSHQDIYVYYMYTALSNPAPWEEKRKITCILFTA